MFLGSHPILAHFLAECLLNFMCHIKNISKIMRELQYEVIKVLLQSMDNKVMQLRKAFVYMSKLYVQYCFKFCHF